MNADGIATALNNLFGDLSKNFGSYLAALAALSVLTMAILQAIKDLTPVRRWFQRSRVRRWLNNHASEARKTNSPTGNPDEAERELVLLATDKDECALYDLPIEQLAGQVNAALSIALDYPNKYRDLLTIVGSRASSEDVQKILSSDFPAPLTPEQEVARPPEEQIERRLKQQEFVDARNRVSHQTQRAVDALQISTGFRWKALLQVASFAVSFLLTLIAEGMRDGAFTYPGGEIVTALIAAFLAPIARDLLAALQKLRS